MAQLIGLRDFLDATYENSVFHYDVRNKKGRCLLKSTQDICRDWKKSRFFGESDPSDGLSS